MRAGCPSTATIKELPPKSAAAVLRRHLETVAVVRPWLDITPASVEGASALRNGCGLLAGHVSVLIGLRSSVEVGRLEQQEGRPRHVREQPLGILTIGWVSACLQSGAGDAFELVLAHDICALRHERRDYGLLVGLATGDPGRFLAEVLVAPLPQAGERDREVASLGCEAVFVALGALAVADAIENALLDEPAQSVGEDVAGDPEALLELVEATQPEERVANDQKRPALPDDLQCPGNRAVLSLVVVPEHESSVARVSCVTKLVVLLSVLKSFVMPLTWRQCHVRPEG